MPIYDQWRAIFGDFAGAVTLCNGLDAFTEACIEDGGRMNNIIERAYTALVAAVQKGRA